MAQIYLSFNIVVINVRRILDANISKRTINYIMKNFLIAPTLFPIEDVEGLTSSTNGHQALITAREHCGHLKKRNNREQRQARNRNPAELVRHAESCIKKLFLNF